MIILARGDQVKETDFYFFYDLKKKVWTFEYFGSQALCILLT